MEVIGTNELFSFLDGKSNVQAVTCRDVGTGAGHQVHSYLELATKIAELQFRNRDYVLFFRGQTGDHRNPRTQHTTLKPSLFRSVPGKLPSSPRKLPNSLTLTQRYGALERAEKALVTHYEQHGFLGRERLKRHRILRWALLQHYEVCPTPLLDVTHSLRIAASFASDGDGDTAFVFVLAVPNVSGAITASSEAGIQIIRLASVCPPSAVRPHIQEGYLLGEYPDMGDFDQKTNYKHFEIDFGRRLIAKFRFNPKEFWSSDVAFPQIGREALYPQNDPFLKLVTDVKLEAGL